MKFKILFLMLFFAFATASAAGVRYKDRLFKVSKANTVTVAKDVPFLDDQGGDNYNTLTSMMNSFGVEPMMYFYNKEIVAKRNLIMDVYEPVNDNAKNRAAIIVCHGGAFVAGSKDDFDQQTVAYTDSLAARGYVTASLEYRQGVLMNEVEKNGKYDETIDSVDFARTVYKAVQDIHAAVRYFRKNADKHGIDTNKIYIVGNSAGGMLALENIYAQSKKDLPAYIDKGTQQLSLGGLEEYGETGVGGHANGVVSLWGAIHDAALVKNSDVPVFLAHGDSDYVIPFKKGYAISDVKRMLGEKSSYLNFLGINLVVHTPTLYGSAVIDSVLNARKVYHEFYAPRGYGLKHEFYDTVVEDKRGNEIVFADSVRNKVFRFLYNLAVDSVPAWKPTSLPRVALAGISRITMGENNRSFTVERGENVAYAVFELNGRRVLSGRASMGQTVGLGALPNGVYYLRVQGDVPRRIAVRE